MAGAAVFGSGAAAATWPLSPHDTAQHLAPPVPVVSDANRLRLRHLQLRDASALARLHQDERVCRHLVDDEPLGRLDRAALFIRRMRHFYWQRPGLGIWHASELRRDGVARFAGWFSLMPCEAAPREVELGSRLAPAVWGQGVALDGGESLLRHAFEGLGLLRVWGACDPANRGARLCLLALGFSEQGMAPYEGGEALYHVLDAPHARHWLHAPRRERLTSAARALRALQAPKT